MAGSKKSRVWLITGTSSGFGKALAEAVIEHGDSVLAAARETDKNANLVVAAPDRFKAVKTDVTNPEQVRNAVQAAVDTFGRIDVVVNNAGYGLFAGVEEASEAQIQHQFDVNVFGLISVTRAALPVLRKQRSGHILMMSSFAGVVGAPGLAWYDATKFAVEGFSEALAAEAEPVGVKVTIIEPGNFRTSWIGPAMEKADPIPDYAPSIDYVRKILTDIQGKQPGDPVKAAQAMIRIVGEEKPPLRLVLGSDALEQIRGKLESQLTEQKQWEEITLSVGFDD